ncbi:MAG TPA: glycosyltransferase family 1 protein, partial [Patescibacteria group bacterium]
MNKHKVAIDVSPLYDGNSVRGVGYYTKWLVMFIQKEISSNPEFQDIQVDLITDKNKLKQGGYDLIHYPYFEPFNLSLPLFSKTPYIISLHDLIPIEFSRHFPVGLKGTLKWNIQKQLAKRSKYILTISNYSKKVISKLLEYDSKNIFVTYLASSPLMHSRISHDTLKTIQEKYHLPDRFILYVGDINWNKNIPNLVRSCLKLKYPLVIVGSAAKKEVPVHPWTKDIHWLQHKYQLLGGDGNGRLILTGFVPDEEISAFYNLATIYCQPSFGEGFGLPPIEAMKSGCPVTASNRGATAEIVSDSAVTFNPGSVRSISKTLRSLWINPQKRILYSKKGVKRAGEFSWKRTALETLRVY